MASRWSKTGKGERESSAHALTYSPLDVIGRSLRSLSWGVTQQGGVYVGCCSIMGQKRKKNTKNKQKQKKNCSYGLFARLWIKNERKILKTRKNAVLSRVQSFCSTTDQTRKRNTKNKKKRCSYGRFARLWVKNERKILKTKQNGVLLRYSHLNETHVYGRNTSQ